MANVIKLKRGSGSDPSASDLAVGELAIRTDTGKIFLKTDGGTVTSFSAGGLSDGDKGDITVSNAGTSWTIDNGAITSAKILDSTIVGGDIAETTISGAKLINNTLTDTQINASAAIAGTKISPDFGSQTIVTTGSASVSGDLDIAADIRHIGDTNTKLSFGTDTINLRTGGASRLQCSDSGVDVAGNITVTGTVDGVDIAALNTTVGTKLPLAGGSLTGDLSINDNSYIRVRTTGDNSSTAIQLEHTGAASFTGTVTAAGLNLNDTNTVLSEGSSNALKITTDSGFVNIGPMNTSWCHFDTDRASFYFAQKASFNGNILPYSDSAHSLGSSGTRWANIYGDNIYGSGANLTSLPAGQLTGTVAAARLDTATTQSAGNNSTKIATTAYTDTAISNLVDSSPSALNTLNELAAALGDDANFSTTVTNNIATKLSLSGGTLTGNLTISNTSPQLIFVDTDHNSDFTIYGSSGVFTIRDTTNNANRFELASDGNATFSGSVTANAFSGSGASLTSLNASNISSGTIAAARLPDVFSGTDFGFGATPGGTPAGKNVFIAIGDSDTGIVQDGDGQLELWSNATEVANIHSVDGYTSAKPITTTGTITGNLFSGSGASLTNVNATTLDSIDSGSFLRSDVTDTFSGAQFTLSHSSNSYPLKIDGTDNAKILLSGANNPYIRWREGSTDKAYIQWATNGYLSLFNQEDNSGIIIRDAIGFTTDGSNYHAIYHAGNDGSGSGLDSDTCDGQHLGTSAAVQFGSVKAGGNAFKIDSYNTNSLRIQGTAATGVQGILGTDSSGDFKYQLYGTGSYVGFLDGAWASWDLKKAYGGQLELDIGGSLYTVWNQQNDGAGSGLDADTLQGSPKSSFPLLTGNNSFTGYNEFGDSTGSVSNDGGWNARLNVAGSQHARLDVKSVSDGIITGLYAHTGHAAGRVGTLSNHKLILMCNGNNRAELSTAGSLSTTSQGTLWGASNDGSGSGLDADTVDGFGTSQSGGANKIAVIGSNGYLYIDDWIRVGNNDGLYCSDGQHLYTGGNSSWKSWINRSDHSTACGIGMESSNGTDRGWAYANSSHVGFLNGDGTWLFKATAANQNALETGGGHTLWHQNNDGSGSGLDADYWDGWNRGDVMDQDLRTTANVTFGNVNVNGTLNLHTGGNNTYGRVNGYGNDNHFIALRGVVANQSGLSISTGHQMTFVEHADAADEGWYFKSNASGTYRELAHIDGKSDLYLVSYDGSNGHKIVFRGGSSTQRANLARIEAKQTTNWGGQIELAGKSANGSLGDAYNVGLRVNGDGKVTKPEQPIASVSSSSTVDLSNTELTSSNFYNTTWTNNGNHFNSSNGRFTCPVDGIYRIFFRASVTINSNIRLRKNGSTINEAYDDNHGHTYTTSSEAVFPANAGDYLHIQVNRLKTIGGSQHKQVTFELLA